MRTITLAALAAALTILASAAAATDQAPAGKIYGKGVSSADTVMISHLLAHPGDYLGKTVRVEGPVVGCCKKRGCWIELASDQEFQKIMLKVEDGEIVFPMEVVGETAVVEGVLQGIPMTYEDACAYLEHEATCQGETFDKATVPAEGITFYQIKGTGAVVRPGVQ
ncbi:MAG: DUF4920 domain-containing protein [Candidatus Krumholzibacteriia bacterium]